MRNTIYIVEFDGNKLLNGEFDFKEEAIKWAEDHISEKPIVAAKDVEYSDEFGGEPIIHGEEEIFHYPIEEVVEKLDQKDLDAMLTDLEAKINADPDSAKLSKDFLRFESVEVKEDINSEIESVASNWDDVHEELKEEVEPIEEDFVLFDPFGCDFSECEPMEVCKDEHRADCCDDLCASPADFLKELAAELGIADEVEISEKECADDSCKEKHEDEIPCENCEDEISENLEEAKDLATVPGEAAYVLAKHRPEIESMCAVSSKDSVEDIKKFIIDIINAEAKDTPAKRRIVFEFDQAKENKTSLLQHVFNVILGAGNLYADPNKKWLRSSLDEDTHPQDAQPEIEHEKAHAEAQKIANENGKEVIYGYFGPNHHGEKRYFGIKPIICNDLKKCTADVIAKYGGGAGSHEISVLVAYPEIDEAKNCDKENKMLFVEEQEMSDAEFAEAFKKGLEEKHDIKNLVEEDSSANNDFVYDFKSADGKEAATLTVSPQGDLDIKFKNFKVDVGEDFGGGDGWEAEEILNGFYDSMTHDFGKKLNDRFKYTFNHDISLDKLVGLDFETGKVDFTKFIQVAKKDINFLDDFITAWAYVEGLEQAKNKIELD